MRDDRRSNLQTLFVVYTATKAAPKRIVLNKFETPQKKKGKNATLEVFDNTKRG